MKISIKNLLAALTKQGLNDIDVDDETSEKVEGTIEKKVETPKVETPKAENIATNKTLNVNGDINKEKVEVRKMVLPKYDEKTGLFSGLTDDMDFELKELCKSVNASVKAKNNQDLINKAIDEKFKQVKLIDGVSPKSIKGLLDIKSIAVNSDGAVVGVDEAFETLKKDNAGLFKTEETKPQSSPLLEGFAPQNVTNINGTPNSFAEAFQMMNNNN